MDAMDLLIVEDDAPLRTIMQLLLEEQPHRFRFADSGNAALAAYEAEQAPDVIVIDVGLPDMSGFELAETLRARGCESKLVAFTGFDDASYRERADAAGFDTYFHKPLDLAAMEAVFAQITGDRERKQP